MSSLRLIVVSMRPRQWLKNGVVLAALVFSLRFTDPVSVARALAAVAVFCLLSGAAYLANDVLDRERDRSHPIKKDRPIASGRLAVSTALVAAGVLAAGALALSVLLDLGGGGEGWLFTPIVVAFLVLQVFYSVVLKHAVILDVLTLSAGFVLRTVAGARVIDVPISSWLLICAFLLAVFLALCKRRHEVLLLEGGADIHRPTLGEYSPALLDQMIAVVTSSTLVAYALYTLAPETQAKFGTDDLKYTIPFVLYGIFRYLYLAYRKDLGGSPEMALLGDAPLLADIAAYLLVAAFILLRGGG